ncbi:MAG TPA: alpha/beta hydrolase [Beijerinckiaceae bacterium]|nr:alpha/beta hydrolase [Beijerinckiaceae bacterium]
MPYVSVEEGDLYYEVHGEGPAFLFCAGTATDGEGWKFYQVPEFSRDRRVIIYDQRGTGQSTVRSKDYSTQRLAADVAALLRHLDAKKAIVLGHSNGGRVAQLVAIEYPELVGKLILASAGGTHSSKGIPLSICLDLMEKGYEGSRREHFIGAGFTPAYVVANPEKVERYLQSKLHNLAPVEVYLRQVAARHDASFQHRLKEIAVPTLVLAGREEEGAWTGVESHLSFAKKLASDIPGATLRIMEESGHNYHYTSPEQTNAVIRDFIAR